MFYWEFRSGIIWIYILDHLILESRATFTKMLEPSEVLSAILTLYKRRRFTDKCYSYFWYWNQMKFIFSLSLLLCRMLNVGLWLYFHSSKADWWFIIYFSTFKLTINYFEFEEKRQYFLISLDCGQNKTFRSHPEPQETLTNSLTVCVEGVSLYNDIIVNVARHSCFF